MERRPQIIYANIVSADIAMVARTDNIA